ncbi:hypothetical protein HDV01_004343 [Terramyces sp. JEL0728]|nr:hypothetical protein HDV01_004343 [Terramyces sp. JEL0728]
MCLLIRTILTNAHVVTDMDDGKIIVRASDGYEFEAEVFSLDTRADLAIVKPVHPQKDKFKPVQFGNVFKIRPGDWVVAIGCPFGLQNTVTAGVVSSRSRHSVEIGAQDDRVRFLQTDCVVHSGSSGGPLINLEGKVIGINTTRAESEGISFAIRIDTCLDMIQQLKKEGKVVRPYLGLQMTSLSPNVFHQLKKSFANSVPHVTHGVLLTRINSGSPAEKAGLQEGDIITQVNSTKITSSQDILSIIGLGFGKPVHIHIKRNVPLEMDWDGRFALILGRVIRYETIDYACKVVPEELDIGIHNVQDNTTTAVGV